MNVSTEASPFLEREMISALRTAAAVIKVRSALKVEGGNNVAQSPFNAQQQWLNT